MSNLKKKTGTWKNRKMKELRMLEIVCDEMECNGLKIIGILKTNCNYSGSFRPTITIQLYHQKNQIGHF